MNVTVMAYEHGCNGVSFSRGVVPVRNVTVNPSQIGAMVLKNSNGIRYIIPTPASTWKKRVVVAMAGSSWAEDAIYAVDQH